MARLPMVPVESNPDGREHLSLSTVNKVLACGKQYKLERIDKLGGPDNLYPILGLAIHAVIADDTQQAIDGNERPTVEQMLDQVYYELLAEAEGRVLTDPVAEDYGADSVDGVIDAMLVRAKHILDAYVSEVRPRIARPIAAELEFRAPMSAGFDILGYVDLVYETEDGLREVVDWKVSTSAKSNPIDEWDGKSAYGLGHAVSFGGRLPDGLSIVKFRHMKTKCAVTWERTTINAAEINDWLQTKAAVAARKIRGDEFHADALGSWLCNYCAVSEHCEEYQVVTVGPWNGSEVAFF